VRFFCEWCHEQVQIQNNLSPYPEVLAHFTGCDRRSPMTTEAQVAGLARHITTIIDGDRKLKQIRQAG
jgi:hypothetical protein